MRKLLFGGLAVVAVMVFLPAHISQRQVHTVVTPDYRSDWRLESLTRFFQRSACPALRYAGEFLAAADSYDLDWRLLPSISFIESTGGKAAPNNNLFGWDAGRAWFPSATAAIHEVGYQLTHSDLYRDKDVDEILATYNPNTGYAAKVKFVMRQIAPVE
ncbi:MAG: glucosaminidase domain-containing protein [Acidobacteriia bacterium]|nr:glucosaminidase domain-containing protein [Terriglobia bacterium]